MLNLIVRSVAIILVGVLLIVQRDAVMPIIVQCLGIAFILPGVIAVTSYIMARRNSGVGGKLNVAYPLAAVGSILLGGWLLFSPTFFVSIIMNLLGIMLSLIGLYQLLTLLVTMRHTRVSIFLFIMPVVLLLMGGFVLFNPFEAASLPFLLLGIGAIIAGLSDFINTLFVTRIKKRHTVEIEEVTPIDDNS